MARPEKGSGEAITLRQFVTLATIARMGGKADTADVRLKLLEGGGEVTPTGIIGSLKNMQLVGWITAKKESRPVGVHGTAMPTNVWKLTESGKAALEKGRQLLAVLKKDKAA